MLRSFRFFLLFVAIVSCASCAFQDNALPSVSLSHTAPFKKISLRYLDEGKGEIPLVFVHGWGGQSHFWRKEIQGLSQDHRVIALDLPGHGASGRLSEPYTQQTFAKSVLAVMDDAHVNRAILVGHSMGANVVRHVALMEPERVAGIVLVDGAIFFLPDGKKQRSDWSHEMRSFVDNLKGPKGEDFTRSFVDSMHGRLTPEWAKKEVMASVMNTPRQVRLSAMTHFIDLSAWPQKKVAAPTLAVYAMSPEVKPSLETDLRTLFPELEYTLWDGPGHFYMLYEAVGLNDEIQAFIQRHGL